MAGCARDGTRLVLVRHAFDVGVAVDTRENLAVNGILEFGWIHVRAARIAVRLGRKTGILMACQALVVARLLCGQGAAGKEKHSAEYLKDPASAPELVFAEPKATGTWLGEQRAAVPHVHAIQPV